MVVVSSRLGLWDEYNFIFNMKSSILSPISPIFLRVGKVW
jgi:hypothetical protein